MPICNNGVQASSKFSGIFAGFGPVYRLTPSFTRNCVA
jgi:hypothetical protein